MQSRCIRPKRRILTSLMPQLHVINWDGNDDLARLLRVPHRNFSSSTHSSNSLFIQKRKPAYTPITPGVDYNLVYDRPNPIPGIYPPPPEYLRKIRDYSLPASDSNSPLHSFR